MNFEVWEFSSEPTYRPSQGVVGIHLAHTREEAERIVTSLSARKYTHGRYYSVRELP